MSEEPGTRHGRDKEPEGDDPMELVMVSLPGGDRELMATCLIEEYARWGMGEEEIFALFRQPIYQTHSLYQERGEDWVRTHIRNILGRTGRTRVSVEVFHHIGDSDA